MAIKQINQTAIQLKVAFTQPYTANVLTLQFSGILKVAFLFRNTLHDTVSTAEAALMRDL
jgi:hypothetical protein